MKKGHKIKSIEKGSIAEELEIRSGDTLISINNEEIEDVFDYRLMIQEEYLEVLVERADGEEWLLEIEKDEEEDLGITFENELMSEYRSCRNKCIFCFIDQMPPGMRETLYFKDDDSRLSFMQGNYITLTNMREKDIDRIIRLHLAPINISVQTTNPQLRCRMLNNRFAGEKLKYLDKLHAAGTEMNGQIVCCKGVNDGEELRHSIEDLMNYIPSMKSVSVVPAGITKYRDGLYPLELFTKEEAGEIIDLIEGYQKICFAESGLHFIHASDEWYINAGREFPEEERYDGYLQLENGVGMMRLFINEFTEALEKLIQSPQYREICDTPHPSVSIATGKLTYPTLSAFAARLEETIPGLSVSVYEIRNDFFGETITVSGLITGQDLTAQLQKKKEEGHPLGERLLIPANMLRTGEHVFLDDMTTEEAEKKLGIRIVPVGAGGKDLIEAVLYDGYHYGRDNGNFVYVQAFDKTE